MSNINANSQNTVPGFWKRLAIGIEEASMSLEERLEKRVSRLEVEVDRLLASQKKQTKD
jgi:hypothetical protein